LNISPPNRPIAEDQEFAFTGEDFQIIAVFAKKQFGLDLQLSKKPLVYSRLAKRLRALNFEKFSQYCSFIKQNPTDPEIDHLLSALTTNVTHFFREMHHFDFFREIIAPDLIARAKNGEVVRIWSAACSAGQEAYCLAAVLLQVDPLAADLNIRILATDIDRKMISAASIGRYSLDQKKAIPLSFHQTMLHEDSDNGNILMHDRLHKLITFNELNLINDWPMKRKFHLIVCRNAAIYFDKTTQATLWERFADNLTSAGHLMIGHSERLSGPAEGSFQSVGITTYRRLNAESPAGAQKNRIG
jgi:chemotaxis protein methyltransferase CheR